jgi:hypothetical protein
VGLSFSYACPAGWGKKLASRQVERHSPAVRFRALFAFGLGLFSSTLAGTALAEEPLPAPAASAPPTDELPPPSARTNLIVTGAATTIVSYGLALGVSYLLPEADLRGSKDLRIPVAGPWLALGRTGCPTSDTSCSVIPLIIGSVLKVIDGVAQAGGLGIAAEGLFLNTSSGRPAPRKAQPGLMPRRYATGPTVQVMPLNFEKGGVGLGVVGTF